MTPSDCIEIINKSEFDTIEAFVHALNGFENIYENPDMRQTAAERLAVPINVVNYVLGGYDADFAAIVRKARFAKDFGQDVGYEVMKTLAGIATGKTQYLEDTFFVDRLDSIKAGDAIRAAKELTRMMGEEPEDNSGSGQIKVVVQQATQVTNGEKQSGQSNVDVIGYQPATAGQLPAPGHKQHYKGSLENPQESTETSESDIIYELDTTIETELR